MAQSKKKADIYGGFWVRTAAMMVDWIILAVPSFALTYLVAQVMLPNGMTEEASPEMNRFQFVQFGIQMGLNLCYFWLLQTWMQGTVGKKAFGLRIASENMKAPTYMQMLKRWLMTIPSGLLLGGGYIAVAVNDKKQGWHDRVAHTLIVRKKAATQKSKMRSAA